MSAPRRFPCSLCEKSFVSARALQTHERDAHFRVSGTRMDTALSTAFDQIFATRSDVANKFTTK